MRKVLPAELRCPVVYTNSSSWCIPFFWQQLVMYQLAPFPPYVAHPCDHFPSGQSGSRGQYQEMAEDFPSFF